MSLYVMVAAVFPFVDLGRRAKIYKCLEGKGWTRVVPEVGGDISTLWYFSFEENLSDAEAVIASREDFINCTKFFTTPKLIIHVCPNKSG